MRQAVVKAVEGLIEALKTGDLSTLPLAPDVVFESPLTPRLEGREQVIKFLRQLAPAVLDVRVLQHVVEGEYCATLYEWHTVHGIVPVFGRFHVQGGMIKSLRTFHDLRLLSEVMVQPAERQAGT